MRLLLALLDMDAGLLVHTKQGGKACPAVPVGMGSGSAAPGSDLEAGAGRGKLPMKTAVAVIGAGVANRETAALAEEVGQRLAEQDVVLVCGGLGGVMEAAARGARKAGGTTVGILPGMGPQEANAYIDIAVVTGLSHARNAIVVRSAGAVIALPGEYGTLSEIALALKMGIPVVGLKAWGDLGGVAYAETAAEAVEKALRFLPSAGRA